MGCWDALCPICGAPVNTHSYESVYENDPDIKDIVSFHVSWMNNVTILLPNGKVVKGCEETSCNVNFDLPYEYINKDKNVLPSVSADNFQIRSSFFKDNVNYAMYMHDDCYDYCKKYLGYNLKYFNFPQDIKYDSYGLFKGIDYKGMEKYGEQDFNFMKMRVEENTHMIVSPMEKNTVLKKLSMKNRTRINKILSQLKLTPSNMKKMKSRPSPHISATSYKQGTHLVGKDNNVWIIKNKKWNKAKDIHKKVLKITNFGKEITRKSKNNAFYHMAYEHERIHSKTPIFVHITDYKYAKNDRYRYKPLSGTFIIKSNDKGFDMLESYLKKAKAKYTMTGPNSKPKISKITKANTKRKVKSKRNTKTKRKVKSKRKAKSKKKKTKAKSKTKSKVKRKTKAKSKVKRKTKKK